MIQIVELGAHNFPGERPANARAKNWRMVCRSSTRDRILRLAQSSASVAERFPTRFRLVRSGQIIKEDGNLQIFTHQTKQNLWEHWEH
jgi:hypothetical protein